VLVISFHEFRDRNPQLFNVAISAAIDDLLFESFIEPLHDSVGLRLRYECKARRNSPELDLVQKMIREILAAVIHPQAQSTGNIGGNRAESLFHGHGKRLQSGKPVSSFGNVPADALGVPMPDNAEQRALTIVDGEYFRAVGTPHDLGGCRDDLAIMFSLARPLATPY
jgi:hypothetical protein